jgi:hypothetical protein
VALDCTVPRLDAALADGPTSILCPCGGCLVFGPGWWCDDCQLCICPDAFRDCDDEPDDDYG